MIIGRRKILLAALVVILGAAIFVNWQFGSVPIDNSDEASKNLGDAQYVNGTNISAPDNSETENKGDYFASMRLERQQARDSIKENYEKVSTDPSATAAEKSEAMVIFARVSENIKKENDIENLVKAKGVNDCIATISGESVTVVVDCEELNDVVLLQIKEIANKQTNISFENITIIQAK